MFKRLLLSSGVVLAAAGSLAAQNQVFYSSTTITGQLTLTATVNATKQSQLASISAQGTLGPEFKVQPQGLLRPPLTSRVSVLSTPQAQPLSVNSTFSGTAFNGITHADQRNANHGNQFSVEPPNASIAVGHGYVLEGVNNAIQVYTVSGTPLLTTTISSNQLFGVSAAIDRNTGINGVFPTDMRVFYDADIDRWFVLQRAQDYDIFGSALNSSHLYLAVSQTSDPTGTYNIYTMDTTNSQDFGCPCFSDYPQLGADKYGFYISANQFNTTFVNFTTAEIYAISKQSLAAGASQPTIARFLIPFTTGYEFTIFPTTTPPGASYFLANGGAEFFVSSQARFGDDNNMAVWMMTNTGSLWSANPVLTLVTKTVPTLAYTLPGVAKQKSGTLTYGSTLTPPRLPSVIDGGDDRILSATYSGGRIYVTLSTQVVDGASNSVIGAAYVIFSPTYRSGVLSAPILREGYFAVNGNYVLRPAISVTPAGRGAIVCTLVGPDYYPTAAVVPIDAMSTGTMLQIAAAGSGPDDGFSGYLGSGLIGLARWGDYSSAATAADGSIWMITEYIPNLPRTQLANWGTSISHYMP